MMQNSKNSLKDNVESSKAAYVFVLLTMLIGRYAMLPIGMHQENEMLRGLEASPAAAFSENINKQTGRYLKMPRWF